MGEKEQRYKEDRRKGAERRTISDCRQSIIVHRELLNFDSQDKRSGADRRSGNEKRLNQLIS